MKKLLILSTALTLAACSTPQMTPAQQQVRPISNADGCQFITTAYFEVGHPSKQHYYAAKNVVAAGGDSYQVMSNGKDSAMGMNIHTTNISIYKCN